MGNLKEDVYNNLKIRIIKNNLEAGKVLNEKLLMDEYKIGRTPLREIFIRLQNEGFIQKFPRSGTIVAPMDFNQLREITEVRIPLEGVVGELAVEKITNEKIEKLKEILNYFNEDKSKIESGISLHGSDEDILRYDTELHNILYEATGNRKLTTIIHELQAIDSRYWFTLTFSRDEYLNQVKQWENIINAIEARDKRLTKKLLQDHVQKFINRFKDRL